MGARKKTAVRQAEIVEAALRVIAERGVRELTVATIAEVAGMSVANIYRHFRDKNELLRAVAEEVGTMVMGRAATVAAGSGSPLAKLATIFRAHLELIAANPGIPRLVFSEELHSGPPTLAEPLALRIALYLETIAGIVAAGQREGEIRQDLAPRETAVTLLGMIQFSTLRWSLSRGAFSLPEEGMRLWNNFETLLRE
ncbi:MAG: TetR/AcrR family transcriptional regulator [Thermodesulfobacteriota bacterium]